MNLLTTIAVVLIAFTIGYKVIGWLMDRVKGSPQSALDSIQDAHESGPWPVGSSREGDKPHTQTYQDPEIRYARVLGLSSSFTRSEIKERYQVLIASYHPDKVNHLGPELQEMASRKTREILEAYEYFRVKYNLK